MTESYELIEHNCDVVIVGAGGAAMWAALGMAASGLRTVSQKSFRPAAIRWRHKVAWPPRSLGGLVACRKRSGGGRRGRHDKVDAECLSRHRIDRKHVWRFG